MDIAKIKKQCDDNKGDIDELKKVSNELDIKSNNAYEDISELKTKIDPAEMNIVLNNRKLKSNGD